MKRHWTIVFFFLLLFTSGCAKQTADAQQTQPLLNVRSIQVPEGILFLDNIITDGECLYVSGFDTEQGIAFCSSSADDPAHFQPFSMNIDENSSVLLSACGGDDTLWLLLSSYYAANDTAEMSLVHVNRDGAVLAQSEDLYAAFNEFADCDFIDMAVDSENNDVYLLNADGHIFSLVNNSPQIKQVSSPYAASCITFNQKYGVVFAVNENETSTVYSLSDPTVSVFDFGHGTAASIHANNTSLLIDNGVSLYTVDLESGAEAKLSDWSNYKISHDEIAGIAYANNGSVFISYTGNSVEGEILLLTNQEAVPDSRKKITIATVEAGSELKQMVAEFNATNTEYVAEIIDYSIYDELNEEFGSVAQLNKDIIAGHAPDIIDFSQLSFETYAAKDILLDLYPYMKNDTELQPSDFLDNILDIYTVDGKLAAITNGFSVVTVVGRTSDLCGIEKWNIDGLYSALEQKGDDISAFSYATKADILRYCCYLAMDQFIDFETSSALFESSDFISLLTLSNSFPDSIDPESTEFESEAELIASGKSLLSIISFNSIDIYQIYLALYGEDISFVGFPTSSEIGSSISPELTLGICKSSAFPEGAWEFIRGMLTYSNQEKLNMCFPIRKDCVQKLLSNAQKEKYFDSSTQEWITNQAQYTWGEMDIPVKTLSDHDVAIISELLTSVDHTIMTDSTVVDIVIDESSYYFAGAIDAETAAKRIQGRVQLYLSELESCF